MMAAKNNISNSSILQPDSSICTVEFMKKSAIGFICEFEFPEYVNRTLLLTSHQDVKINNVTELDNMKLTFGDQTIGNLLLTPDCGYISCSLPINEPTVTVIQFSRMFLKIHPQIESCRLRPASIVERKDVTIFQYSSGVKTQIKGHINETNGSEIKFYVKKQLQSAGSPLLNRQNKVVGIHIKRFDTSQSYNKLDRSKQTAIDIKIILEGFKNHLLHSLGGRTENETWLEILNEIPQK